MFISAYNFLVIFTFFEGNVLEVIRNMHDEISKNVLSKFSSVMEKKLNEDEPNLIN